MPKEPKGTPRVLYTPAEVAEMLAIDREHVYRLCGSGELRSVVLDGDRGGRRRRIFADSVHEYLGRQPTDGVSA